MVKMQPNLDKYKYKKIQFFIFILHFLELCLRKMNLSPPTFERSRAITACYCGAKVLTPLDMKRHRYCVYPTNKAPKLETTPDTPTPDTPDTPTNTTLAYSYTPPISMVIRYTETICYSCGGNNIKDSTKPFDCCCYFK